VVEDSIHVTTTVGVTASAASVPTSTALLNGAVAGAAAAGSQANNDDRPKKPARNTACNSQPATSFAQANKANAAALADQMSANVGKAIPSNYILAVAGDESTYGTSPIALGAHNYFGMWAGAPGSTGPWPGNPIVSQFPGGNGFMSSGQSFVKVASPLLRGIPNMTETAFFTAIHAKWGVGSTLQTYLNKMTGQKGVANMTATRMNCP
jgi:hypothetical protein